MAANLNAELNALIVASKAGGMAEVLMAMHAHPDLGDWGGRLLIAAVQNGAIEVVRLLLERDVDLGYTKEAGWTALCYAIETGRKDVAELLMAAGATMTGTGRRRGQTLLMYAVQRRDPDVTKLLLEHTGPQGINETDHLGRTALHMACEGNRVEVIKVLLLAGADYKMRDLTGRTPLDTINHGRQQTPDQRCIRLLNMWEDQLQQPEVIYRARWMYEKKPHAIQGPHRLPSEDQAAFPVDCTGIQLPLPNVAMRAAREKEDLRGLTNRLLTKRLRENREGYMLDIDRERCAVLRYVVKELEPNLFKELMLGFKFPVG